MPIMSTEKVDNDKYDCNKILDGRFRIEGCAVSRACASIAAALAKGLDLETAWDIDETQIAGRSAKNSGGSPALPCFGPGYT